MLNLYDVTPGELEREFDIVCPRCGRKASLARIPDAAGSTEWRMTCTRCGLARRHGLVRAAVLERPGSAKGPLIATCPEESPWPFELWYQAECCGHTLYARNAGHLRALKEHVAAKLRGRRGPPWKNQSIASRLPRWLTAAHNRDAVLRTIEALERKAD